MQHVYLFLNWYNFDEKVVMTMGKISSIDPTSKMHHMSFGRDCWKVWVDEVINGNVRLYRPTDESRTMNDAHGTTTASPKSCIKLED